MTTQPEGSWQRPEDYEKADLKEEGLLLASLVLCRSSRIAFQTYSPISPISMTPTLIVRTWLLEYSVSVLVDTHK